MPAKDESLKSPRKAKKELDISKLSKVKNRKIARTFRRKEILAPIKRVINWRKLWAYSGILAVATLLVYGPALFGNLVFNDSLNIQIKTLAYPVDTLWLQLVSMIQMKPFGQPWTLATYFWDTASFPGNPAWYHFVNITLHLLTSIYLFLFVFQTFFWFKEERRIKFDPYDGAMVVALLFMCHPLAAGTVSYLSGRSGLLAGCNLMLALNFFMVGFYTIEAFPIIGWYFASILFLVIGILCSTQAVSFPFIIVGLAFLLKPPKESLNIWMKERWQDFAIFGLTGVAAVATLMTQAPALLDNGVDTNLLSRFDWSMAQASAIVTYFLRYLIVPIGLTINDPTPGNLVTPLAVLGFAVLIAFAVSLRWLRKYPLAILGGGITIGGLITNFIFVQHEIASDQRYYIPLIGLALLAGTLLIERYAINKQHVKIGLAIIAVLSGITIWRETIWSNEKSLWTAATQWSPDARNLGMLARAQYTNGSSDCVATAKKSLKLDPKCAPANEALGLYSVNTRKYKEALEPFKQAVATAKEQKTVPEKLSIYEEELADAAMRAEDWPTARDAAKEASLIRPGMAQIHLVLGKAYLAEKNASGAFQELNLGTQLDKYNPEFLEPTADACLMLGSPNYVAYGYTKAKQAAKITQTKHAVLTYIIAALEMGKIPEAKEQLGTFLSQRGSSAEGLYLLSIAEKLDHNMEKAQKWSELAKIKDPDIANKVHVNPVDLSEMRAEMRRSRAEQGMPTPGDDRPRSPLEALKHKGVTTDPTTTSTAPTNSNTAAGQTTPSTANTSTKPGSQGAQGSLDKPGTVINKVRPSSPVSPDVTQPTPTTPPQTSSPAPAAQTPANQVAPAVRK